MKVTVRFCFLMQGNCQRNRIAQELMAEACHGDLNVLTDGETQVVLEPHVPLDTEKDTAELEAELRRRSTGLFSIL